ncbi:MAG: rsmC [Micrococcaceae bacterium]|jgi:16S rRNA (guanine1207-N2)-methyltransferase|nr:rsmC [Micrococcaceae bacterium]
MDQAGEFLGFDFGRLRRFPDVEAPNLFAVDATDRLLLSVAAPALPGLEDGGLVVLNDRYGALTLGAGALYGMGNIRVHQDARSGELALRNNALLVEQPPEFAQLPLGADLVEGARVVLWQLPRSLDELTEVADLLARHAAPDVQIFAGGRVKHMARAMNTVLERYFGSVQAGLAQQKSRVLTVREPVRPTQPPPFPVRQHQPDLDLDLSAHGATFAGATLDIGTRFLLTFLDRMKPDSVYAVDLGCGSGVVAAALASARADLQVTATDQSAAAVASAAETAALNGLQDRIRVVQDDAMAGFAPASADLILLNPPFHVGASVHAGAALKLFDAAARVLRPGGELWTVYNTHLDYRGQLDARVGPTRVQGRNAKFTVTSTVRR